MKTSYFIIEMTHFPFKRRKADSSILYCDDWGKWHHSAQGKLVKTT